MDIDYNAVFGIDDTGENAQESAAPAAETDGIGEKAQGLAEPVNDDAGANGQEVAEPVNETENTESEDTLDSEIEDDENEALPGPGADADGISKRQSPEERAKYAAARRKAEAERDAAIARAKAEAEAEVQRRVDEAFADSGLINPFTGQPIKSKSEFDEYLSRYTQQQKDRIIDSSNMSESEYQQFVNSLPEVRAAKEQAAEAERARREAAEVKAKANIDAQIKEINRIDPSIKSLSDLAVLPNYRQFYELVKKGNNFVDAYKLVNFEALTNKAQAAAKQAALNAAKSKDHMQPKVSRGQGQDPVPSEIAAEYRAFIPDASDAEIARHYNAYMKNRR